jgi:hypothetical protein
MRPSRHRTADQQCGRSCTTRPMVSDHRGLTAFVGCLRSADHYFHGAKETGSHEPSDEQDGWWSVRTAGPSDQQCWVRRGCWSDSSIHARAQCGQSVVGRYRCSCYHVDLPKEERDSLNDTTRSGGLWAGMAPGAQWRVRLTRVHRRAAPDPCLPPRSQVRLVLRLRPPLDPPP